MVILVRALSTCHVILLVLGRYTSIVPPLENNQETTNTNPKTYRGSTVTIDSGELCVK
ncbi:hypothetical protein K402DRAFT_396214 [Aulographum hederae CBS 113979]|uniref:Uncharacterized protein n=1 Tax=Aulographum hederae CBS 113979 TaxID=1176131 RepID=A0A6G1GSQ3_9PEZI|nr:hypothetical protein K402DRAFT_396214 [Aulographum hederae CBS 113979]